jgi:hypothetical protein
MNPKDILEYAVEGIKWLAIGGGAYFGTLAGCQISTFTPHQEEIKSQEELEKVVKEKAEKLGLDSSKIYPIYYGYYNKTGILKEGERYEMHFVADGFTRTEGVIDHELCHYANGDCDRAKDYYDRTGRSNFLHSWLIEEPRATLYGTFGIKIGWKKK